jgi:UDP-N-acetylglucosamine enolpyruvyl transferase
MRIIMHFSTVTLAVMAMASSALAGPTALEVRAAAISAAGGCTVGAYYCGWYLRGLGKLC